NDAVIGADLHNEPAGPATWGSGNPKTDWAMAAEMAGNAILDVNPNWLIFVEGIEKITDKDDNPLDWTWQGGELIPAGSRPIHLKIANRVVYSPHDYGPSVYNQRWFQDPTFPDNMPEFWDQHWGYLQRQGVAPVLVGEFGGRSVGTDIEGTWQRTLVHYLHANQIHYTYWCLNPDSGDTGGLLEDDWVTIHPDKQALLKTYQGKMLQNSAPDVVDESAVP
ncbi:MAG TPA: cellulase family glycosylhydrolase, partial [Chloroflexota bacterium]|nr:cellulase family glycosylhydrolase [Chloroflexota bacterium]